MVFTKLDISNFLKAQERQKEIDDMIQLELLAQMKLKEEKALKLFGKPKK